MKTQGLTAEEILQSLGDVLTELTGFIPKALSTTSTILRCESIYLSCPVERDLLTYIYQCALLVQYILPNVKESNVSGTVSSVLEMCRLITQSKLPSNDIFATSIRNLSLFFAGLVSTQYFGDKGMLNTFFQADVSRKC